MKNFLRLTALAICAIFMVSNASAQVITAERASEIANQFFANGKQKSAAFRSTNATLTQSIDSRAVTGESNDAPTFHILTGADGKGFVIVSGEETENPIIGYSLDGTIDTNNLPDGFVGYMSDIDAQVRALREYNAANPQKAAAARSAMQKTNYNATSMGNIQVLLETAKWGQGSPFNRLCFTDATHTTNAATGCVPTAFAIVMRYHKWPEEGIGRLVDFQLSTSELIYITDRTYDWDNMPLVYDGNWSDYQINEVAKVMRDLGHTYMVEYGQNNTGVSVPGSSGKLETYFNYNNISGVSQAQVGSIDDWKARIRESLNNNCPIPYKSHNSASGDSNHMFVLDGYTDNDYFHFNWGWSGSGNGWFKLDNMQPLGSNYSWGASSDHMAIFNLTPKKTPRTVTVSANPAGAGSVTVNGNANTADVTEGTAATLEATANSGYTFSHWSKGGAQVSTEKTYKAVVAAEGNVYVANFYTIGSSVNIPVNYDSNMGSVTYNGNIVSATGFTPNEYSEVTLTAEANDGYMFTGWEIVEGTESTESNDNTVTFIAKNGITVNANFALAGGEYKINSSNITPSGTGKCSTWTYSKEGDIEGILTLSTANGSTVVNALGTSNRLYAHAYDDSSNGFREITYTLTAKEGFVITGYSLTYVVSKAGQVTVRNATQTQTPSDTQQYTLTYQYANAARSTAYGTRSTDFVLSSTTASNSQYITIKDLSVTVLSEGGEGGGTTDPDTPTTPTTYTISVSATEGGSAYVGTGTSTTVTAGNSVMLTATTNNGYTFDGWYNGTTRVSTSLQYTFTPTASGTYQAKFTANATPEQPSTGTNLAGKYFRLKTTVNGAAKYMNVADNNTHTTGAYGGVNVVTLDESSNAQIFYFEASGDGYKLKDKNGYYIKGQEWNVDANSTVAANGSVLLFEETDNINEYYIKWNNTTKGGIRYFKVGLGQNTSNYYPYGDEANKASAAVWVLEEVIPSLTVTFANATWGNASGGYYDYVTTNTDPLVTVRTANGGKAIGYSTINDVKHPYLLHNNNFTISVPAPYKIAGYRLTYKGHDFGSNKTFTYTTAQGSTTETITQNGVEKTLTVTGLETSEIAINVSDNSSKAGVIITALEITYIEDTDLETYTVAVTAGENGTATASAATVVEGDNVILTATANSGYKFAGWYDGETKVSEANPYTFAVTSNINYEARFEELFPDGAYKIYWQQNNRGYLAYHETNSPSKAVLADVTYTGCANLHYNSSSDPVNLNWYLITADDGKRYLFQATTGKFLGYESGTTNNKLNLTEALPIAIEENIKHSGYYIITSTINNNSRVLLCSACGTETKNNGNGVRWLDVTDSNQQDGGAPLKFVPVSDVTVAESVMNTVLRVINGNNAVPFKVEIEGLRENDPNTHFATITVGGTAVKLAPAHLTQSEIEATLVAGSRLAINHKYRGIEFNGFYIGTTSLGESATLTDEQIAAISATTPLVAKFTATNTGEATLFSAEDEFSYRIPAIVKTVKDDKHKLIAISDYRHSFDDIGRDNHKTGTTQVDLVIRTSEDNGATWTAKQTIAEGSQHFGYGDAAAVANGQDVLVMAVAGNVFYAYADSNNPQQAYRIYSNDNGVTWEKEDISSNMESLFPDYHGLFFGSGKLAVDPDFNGSGNARVYGAILMKDSQGERNYVLYSDNWGKTWNILGGTSPASANEPKVEILPNGQILLSARRGGGRTFNVFTYTNKANSTGTWSTAANGCNNGGNSTNGEIICLDAKKPNGKPTKILLQSQPYGSDRRNVSIWYKEIGANETYTASSIASDWTMGKQVSTQLSAYSAMCLQANGEIALFFEEAPCYGDDHTKGYSMVYVPLTIEEATDGAFLNPNADVETVTVDVTLTDNEGNTYTHQFDYLPGDAAAIDAALMTAYPFITELGKGNLQGSDTYYTYTNTVTLPFRVSNNETIVWHNIYWPSYNPSSGKIGCPVYLSATDGEQYVPKVTADALYGASEYNTLDWADRLSWAVYSVNNSFTFKFKNKSADKYIQVTSVANGNTQNTVYADEANATVFTLLKDTGTRNGDYALAAKVDETTGYLCSTSAGYGWATHFEHTNHEGAWVVFQEEEVVSSYQDLNTILNLFGEGKLHVINDDVQEIITALDNPNNITLNTLVQYGAVLDYAMKNWKTLTLTVNDAMGSVTINNEARKTKKAPSGFEFTVVATPAEGYRFTHWSNGTTNVSSEASYTFNMPDAATGLTANFEIEESQDGLTTGYYHIVSRVTTSHEYLYNNALRTNNSKKYTLQSDSKIATNNGIWHITVNNNELGVKNGDGNALVTGASYRGAATTHNTLNIEKTTDVGGVTYYSFTEGINCTNRDQYNFTLEGGNSVSSTDNNYVTTWTGHPDDQANQWRLELVNTDGKNIYDVVVECTEKDVYVVYGSGTNEEYAFNGGFFITDATITAQQLTAKKNNADAQGVTVLVEGNTIRVVDTEYVEITVSASPAEGGTVTINGQTVSTSQVVKSSNVTVVATPASGYHFVNWTDAGGNKVSTDASYTFTASESTSLVANFEADVVYHTITVSTYYNNNGGTVKVGEEDATSVNVAEGESVRMLATVADGYEFMGWLKDGVIVKNAIDGGLDFEVQGPDYTLYEIKASAEYVAVFSKITETTGLEDGKAYRICGVQGNGQARCIYRDGNTLKWKYDYDNNDVNTIFVAQKNGNAINLISAVGYHGWKTGNTLGNDEPELYNPYAAIKVTYGTRDELRTLYIESGTSSGLFQTNTDGAFSFQNSRGGGLTMIATDEATTDFLFEEVETYAFQVSAADGSNAKLGTVNLPFATTVPAEVTVYGVNDSNEDYVYVAPLELTDNVLPANTPVLIEAAASRKYGFKPAPASANVYETGFAGTLEAEAIPGTTNAYILSYNGAGTTIKMYRLSSTERTINANKAYYIDSTGRASTLQFVFGETTDIDDVEREDTEDTIYDLKGRKLSEITEPGFYIVNGKKIFVK